MTVNKNSIQLFRIITDVIILVLAFFIVLVITHHQFDFNLPLINLLVIIIIFWILGGKTSFLYDDFRSRTFTYQLMSIFRNSIYLLIIMLFGFFIFKDQFLSRPRVFIILFSLSTLIGISLKEYILRHFFVFLRQRGLNIRNLVIIGINNVGIEFSKLVKLYPHFGYNLVGFIGEKSSVNSKVNILGSIDELEKILSNNPIHEVIVALSDCTSGGYEKIIRICNKRAVKVKIIPDYFRFLSKKFKTSTFGEFPVISVRAEPLEEVQWRFFKRIFDILFSSIIILLVFSWLFPIIIIIQKIYSKGPIFFTQKRYGRNSEIINVFKFRTMYLNSEDKFNPTTKEDPRVTKLGKILRKTNLDEIPQFINVFLGSMSIVGPRPHALNFEKKYAESVEEIRMRHSIKPGITGWAQINGLRGDIEGDEKNRLHIRKKISYDLWYIENWSFSLDLNIIFLTVWKMAKGDPNAY